MTSMGHAHISRDSLEGKDGPVQATDSSILIIGPHDVEALLTAEEIIQTQEGCFVALSAGTSQLGERVLLTGAAGSTAFSYAARTSPLSPAVSKFGAVVPGNKARGLPTVSAIVVALDADTGRPAAIIDGDALTSRRTVAASIVAARALGAPSPRVAVVGLGTQGTLHAQAAVKHLGSRVVTLWDPRLAKATALARRMQQRSSGIEVRPSASPAEAVGEADIVFLCTSSYEPVLANGWVKAGALIISIGSFAPDRREVERELMEEARLVVDHLPTAIRQCGQIVDAVSAGVVRASDIVEIGAVLAGSVDAKEDRVTVYSSVGVGVQDAAVVTELLQRVESAQLQRITW